MVGNIFITRHGYDPELGKHVKDPTLGPASSLGACRPDIRRKLSVGDHVFAISGKVPFALQFVMGGFEVAAKLDAKEAYRLFPEQRLHLLTDGQLTGNVIVDETGHQHELDGHRKATFAKRTDNYVVGTNCLALTSPAEIAAGRRETLEALQEILKKSGDSPIKIVGRFGTQLSERQVEQLRDWLASLKNAARGAALVTH